MEETVDYANFISTRAFLGNRYVALKRECLRLRGWTFEWFLQGIRKRYIEHESLVLMTGDAEA